MWDMCVGDNNGPLCATCDDAAGRFKVNSALMCTACPASVTTALGKSAALALVAVLLIYIFWSFRGKVASLIIRYRKYNKMIGDSW